MDRLGRRSLLLIGGTALALLLGVVFVLARALNGPPPTRSTAEIALTVTPVATATLPIHATVYPTATAQPQTRAATATPLPHPLPVPPNPPPPAHNLPPPTQAPATPTPRPTATPTLLTTPCASGSTGCGGTPVPATATSVSTPTATPGPCQSGGTKYYVTPTATPTTATIAGAITTAAGRNAIPAALEEGIAWQESGWQQNIVACDGGIGLMQLQPSTVAWLNTYYHVNDDPTALNENAGLGAGYLAYFYQYYITYLQQKVPAACGTAGCNWDTPWPGATDGANVRDIVISVYNEGAGTMSQYGIINWWYVNDVLLWMQQAPWTKR